MSAKLIFQSAMRRSMISIAATAQSEAAATSKSFGGFFEGRHSSSGAQPQAGIVNT